MISINNISSKNLLENIFLSLNKKDLLTCRIVCRSFHEMISQNIRFQRLLGLYNAVIVSSNVIESKDWKQKLLESAQQSVEISGNFCGGKIFRSYLSILKNKLNESKRFKVHIISSKTLLEEKDISTLNALKAQYSPRFHFIISTQKWTWGGKMIENHMKLLIVDGKYFMVGGTGFQDNLLSDDPNFKSNHIKGKLSAPAHQDMDLVGKGSLGSRLRQIFFNLLEQLEIEENGKTGIKNHYFSVLIKKGKCEAFNRHEKKIKGVHLIPYTSFPRQGKDEITSTIISFFKQAQENIFVASLGFSPQSKMVNALENRKQKVQATLITNSPSADKMCITMYGLISAPYYSYFNKIFIYNKNKTLYHTKLVTIDEKMALIGSYNLTSKSGSSTYEIMLRVNDSRVVKELCKQLQTDISYSKVFQTNEQSFIQNSAGKSLSTFFSEFL